MTATWRIAPLVATLTIAVCAASATSSTSFSILVSFAGNSTGDGANPKSGMIADRDGVLYGTTQYGGGSYICKPRGTGCGAVFSLTPKHGGGGYTERILYAFTGFGGDGQYPLGGLALHDGVLFGTTSSGSGNAKDGTVFALTPNGSGYVETILYRFGGIDKGDGSAPQGQLITDANGNIFGTTSAGGNGCSGGCGTVFELSKNGSKYVEHVLYAFAGTGTSGRNPVAGLVMDNNGGLYGTTVSGGSGPFCSGGCGTVYALMPKGQFQYAFSVLYSFQGGADGEFPYARLRFGKGGTMFGTTLGGGYACRGAQGCGTVFQLVPRSSGYAEHVLYRFQGNSDGLAPTTRLVMGAHNVLYGTTTRGGDSQCGCGTVYQLTPNKRGYTSQILYELFDGPPDGDLISDKTGALFGTTYGHAGFSFGSAFEVTQ